VSLAALRGRLVLLDFWTLACVNCQRVIEELRGLERRFADVLVVVGVHSPKFPHEHDHAAVAAAVARHRIEHPVLDDPGLRLWDAYAVRAWPTLVLVDADGRVALTVSGEQQSVRLAAAIEQLVEEARAAGTLRPGGRPAAGDAPEGRGELAFPGKVAVDAGGDRLAIADTGHDRVLICALDGEVVEELDGLYQPQGVCFDRGSGLVVCETGADRVWRIGLGGGERRLVTDRLRSPWDVTWWHGHLVLAEAGRHRLWAVDRAGDLQVLAGTGTEGLADGPGLEAMLAQPSGVAVTGDGHLAFVDAEASALRLLTMPDLRVATLVGTGLFAWGAQDGEGGAARMQHPLGVAVAPDGALYVADTFNGLLRVWRGAHLWTVPVEGFAEPGGLTVLPDGRLVVADTANHRVVLVDPIEAAAVELPVGGGGSADAPARLPAAVAETIVQPAGSALPVSLTVDVGDDALDGAAGAPVRVRAVATAPELLREPSSWVLDALPAEVELSLGEGSGRVTVELLVATCGPDACRLRRTQRAYDVLLT
jgi:DNA-binding beta-propeller fold protein YncE